MNIPVETLLLERGLLTERQLRRAMEFRERCPDKALEEILLDFGYVSEAALLACLGERDGLEVVDLSEYVTAKVTGPWKTPGSMSIGSIVVGIVLTEIAVTASLLRADGQLEFWLPGMDAQEFRNSFADSSAASFSLSL